MSIRDDILATNLKTWAPIEAFGRKLFTPKLSFRESRKLRELITQTSTGDDSDVKIIKFVIERTYDGKDQVFTDADMDWFLDHPDPDQIVQAFLAIVNANSVSADKVDESKKV